MVLPISSDALLAELSAAESLISKWKLKVQDGIPAVDVPSTEESLEDFVRQLCGELLLLSAKVETIATVITEAQ